MLKVNAQEPDKVERIKAYIQNQIKENQENYGNYSCGEYVDGKIVALEDLLNEIDNI